jgi:hypothetical protein
VLVFKLLSLLLLIVIFWEDMRYRAVHWFLFPLLAVMLTSTYLTSHAGLNTLLINAVADISFLVLQFILITLYFSIRQKSMVNVFNSLIGWGDLLLLLTLCFYCSLLNFIGFYLLSLLLILAGWLGYRLVFSRDNKQIPLAGLQALLFAGIMAFSWFGSGVNLTQDDWLLNFLAK